MVELVSFMERSQKYPNAGKIRKVVEGKVHFSTLQIYCKYPWFPVVSPLNQPNETGGFPLPIVVSCFFPKSMHVNHMANLGYPVAHFSFKRKNRCNNNKNNHNMCILYIYISLSLSLSLSLPIAFRLGPLNICLLSRRLRSFASSSHSLSRSSPAWRGPAVQPVARWPLWPPWDGMLGYYGSMDWFKGKSTGNHRFSH